MKAKKYEIDGREIHLPEGCRYTVVCWNCGQETLSLQKDGLEYTATRFIRRGSPYIQFAFVREGEGDNWIDSDSPVAGGFSLGFAHMLRRELQVACDYLSWIMAQS